MCTSTAVSYPWRTEESIRSPGTRITELLAAMWIVGFELWSPARTPGAPTAKPSFQPPNLSTLNVLSQRAWYQFPRAVYTMGANEEIQTRADFSQNQEGKHSCPMNVKQLLEADFR